MWSRTISYTIQLEYKVAPILPHQFLTHPETPELTDTPGILMHQQETMTSPDDHQRATEEPLRPPTIPPSWAYVVRDDGSSYYMNPYSMNETVEIVNAEETGEVDFRSGGQGGGPLSPITPLTRSKTPLQLPDGRSQHVKQDHETKNNTSDVRQNLAACVLQANMRGFKTRTTLRTQRQVASVEPNYNSDDKPNHHIRQDEMQIEGMDLREADVSNMDDQQEQKLDDGRTSSEHLKKKDFVWGGAKSFRQAAKDVKLAHRRADPLTADQNMQQSLSYLSKAHAGVLLCVDLVQN